MAFISERVQKKIEAIEDKLRQEDPSREENIKFYTSGHQLLRSRGLTTSFIMELHDVAAVSYCENRNGTEVLHLVLSNGARNILDFKSSKDMLACRVVINSYLEKRKKTALFMELTKANPLASAKDTWLKVDEMWDSFVARECTEFLL